jgi:hypothetical protein
MATFLRPGPGVGSVEHFYHFTLEYLLPLFEYDMTHDITGRGYVVRDCGPLNVWLDFVFGPNAFTRVPREYFAQERPRRFWDKHVQLDAFAGQEGISIDSERFTQVLSAFREKFMPPVADRTAITIIERRAPSSFYTDGAAEKPGGGSTRRSISNLDQLAQTLSAHYPVRVVDFATMTPADQIDTINTTAVLIGQHGAGLTHSLFLHNDAILVELNTTDWDQVWYQTLNSDLGLRYHRFSLDGLHATLKHELIHEISDFVSMTE